MGENQLTEQETLVFALQQALRSSGDPVQLFETHISWVLVAGAHAYKIKKAVQFDYLDFSSLAARRHFCLEEVRLNRRLARALYLGVVPVTGTPAQPYLGGAGEPIDYAVKMLSFPQQALWSARVARQALAPAEADALALRLARFHLSAPRSAADSPRGAIELLGQVQIENMAALGALAGERRQAGLARLRARQDAVLYELGSEFGARKAAGFVRECHGDLHCGNILTLDHQVLAFDCVEFSERLRWIDVMHDLAFACMDLRRRGAAGRAASLLNEYLARTGDYAGVAVLRYYEAECALVRAKIELTRARQNGIEPEDEGAHDADIAALLAEAARAAFPEQPWLVVMHGFSGSGKSTIARQLVEELGAVQVRSDVERKRMCGIDPFDAGRTVLSPRLYDQRTTEAVYERLGTLAATLVRAGTPVVIDACCLQQREREAFMSLAASLGVPALLVSVTASPAVLQSRIRTRRASGADPSDADTAVLARQVSAHQPLSEAELARALVVDSETPVDGRQLAAGVVRRLHGAA